MVKSSNTRPFEVTPSLTGVDNFKNVITEDHIYSKPAVLTKQKVENQNFIKIALINARSLKNKVFSISDSLDSKGISICGVTETWTVGEDEVITKTFSEFGFNLTHNPRTMRKGGGSVYLAKIIFL